MKTLTEFRKTMLEPETYLEQVQLIESRIDFLKDKFANGISTSHDPEAKHTTPEKIITHLAKNADPTESKQHLTWIVNKYNSGDFKQSEVKNVHKTLDHFERLKKHLANKDLNSYASISDVKDAVTPQLPRLKGIEAPKAPIHDENNGLIKEYDKDGVKGYSIPSRELSIKNYGAGGRMCKTSWCTAANSNQNMFDSYSGSGKLYTVHTPKGKVLQFTHTAHGSGEIRDPQNRTPTMSSLGEHEQHVREFISQTNPGSTPSKLTDQYGKFDAAHAQHQIDLAHDKYKDVYVQERNAGRNELESHRAAMMKSSGSIHTGQGMQLSKLASNMPMTDENFNKLHTLGYRQALSKNPNLQPHHIDKLME